MTSSLSPAQRLAHHAKMAVHRAGFDVRRETFKRHFVHSLLEHGVTAVLDVGANKGQFAGELRRAGFDGRIVSLEPLAEAYAQLQVASADDVSWATKRAAVGAEVGTLTMNVAGNSVSSSVLPMLGRHADAAPQSRYVATEDVPAVTVDDLVAEYALPPATTFLKIDVQGYEAQVIDGAATALTEVVGVRTEMSLVGLYDGQALFADLLARLTSYGFELWSIEPGFVEPGTGRLLQVDGVFFRAPTLEDPDGQ